MNHRARKSRWIVAGVTAAAAASAMLALPTANGAEPEAKQTVLDRAILAQYGRVIGVRGSAPMIRNSMASEYCQKHGFGFGDGQCTITEFTEESRTVTPNHMKRVGDYLYNCSADDADKAVTWSRWNEAYNKVGGSVGLSVSAEASFIVGGGWSVSAKQTYSYSWGERSTQSGRDTLTAKPGYVAWWEYGTYYGTVHGIANVIISRPGEGMLPGSFRVVADITGDLPKPGKKADRKAQTIKGLVSQTRKMTAGERKACNTAATEGGDVFTRADPTY
ncbi:hypothetical protein AB0N17_43940 [Streptomyces sp. NPDC051133]|uniref:hypothetical protein n=1 Tax=Streptomyces sp. NPDC051133 TaxID=3155521 RepID=UPI00343277A7